MVSLCRRPILAYLIWLLHYTLSFLSCATRRLRHLAHHHLSAQLSPRRYIRKLEAILELALAATSGIDGACVSLLHLNTSLSIGTLEFGLIEFEDQLVCLACLLRRVEKLLIRTIQPAPTMHILLLDSFSYMFW